MSEWAAAHNLFQNLIENCPSQSGTTTIMPIMKVLSGSCFERTDNVSGKGTCSKECSEDDVSTNEYHV